MRYDIEAPRFPEIGRIEIGYAHSSIMGITVGPDNKIYYTDFINRLVVRIDNSMVNPIGVEEKSPLTFRVSPNPASNGFSRIQLDGDARNAVVLVKDLTGRTVQQLPVNGQSTIDLNLGTLAAGMYMVMLADSRTGAPLGSKLLVVEYTAHPPSLRP